MSDEKLSVWDLAGLDESGMPIHLPMGVNRSGQGPVNDADAFAFVCWCADQKCPVTLALRQARDAGRASERTERHEAVRTLVTAAAPLMWATTGSLASAVHNATGYIEELTRQRDLLAQAIWDARTALGFDTDGDRKFHTTNFDLVAEQHVADVKEHVADTEAALEAEHDPSGAIEDAQEEMRLSIVNELEEASLMLLTSTEEEGASLAAAILSRATTIAKLAPRPRVK